MGVLFLHFSKPQSLSSFPQSYIYLSFLLMMKWFLVGMAPSNYFRSISKVFVVAPDLYTIHFHLESRCKKGEKHNLA